MPLSSLSVSLSSSLESDTLERYLAESDKAKDDEYDSKYETTV